MHGNNRKLSKTVTKEMKKITAIILILIFGNESSAQGKIFVTISEFESNKGVCKICLFANAASFAGKGAAFKCADLQVVNKKASHVFNAVPAGIYAIAVFHDKNNNNKIDKNFFGIPKETYGASKNNLPFAKAPNFEDNQFIVADASSINIDVRLRNL
jgi:uncharacterized protein (DUF2141 family)